MLRAAILFFASSACLAQPRDPLRDTVEWTVSLRGYMAQMTNPVVRVYGTASLARAVCTVDVAAASSLYRDAIASLFTISNSAFGDRGTTVLPVASFSGLWKYVIPAALKCDPGLAAVAENQRARERMIAERTGANATLANAYALISPQMPLDKQMNLDRAAQVGGAAIEAGDPDTLDLATLSLLLSSLVTRAPDLSDDLFVHSVEFVMSEEAPSPDGLQALAKYLFTAPGMAGQADEDQSGKHYMIAGATVENFSAARNSANPDNIEALIDATLKLLGIPAAVNRNPAVAYALASQLLPPARDLMPERVPDLEKAIAQLEAENSGVVAQVKAKLGAADNPDQESGDPAVRLAWLIRQIRNALASGQFDRARELLASVQDTAARGQLRALIDFAEAARAVEKHHEQAPTMANQLRPGIKRALLYISLVANAPRLDLALQILPLASKDITLLPAEQRVRLLAALAAALLRTDVDSSLGVMSQLITAYNDVRANPRKGKFDPSSARRTYNSNGGTDSALIQAGNRGFYEAVQTERGRQNFGLRASGADTFTLAAFLAGAGTVDPDRLSAIFRDLLDENTRAAAWVALAELRLKAARGR